MQHSETIVACITGAPPTGVAWLRLSGNDAYRIAATVFSPWPEDPEPQKAVRGRYVHEDDGLALPFPTGHSYTGEETVELSIHGSRASIDGLLDACVAAGARLAQPGEFTMRAFLNGRIDLTQAEAVADTIEAETQTQLRVATRNREGALLRTVGEVTEGVAEALARIEASVDFSEEVGEIDLPELAAHTERLAARVDQIVATGQASHLARSGVRVAILGRPNAGKSSLLNALLGFDRAIVTAIPGTTRDTVEEAVDLQGVRAVFVDTAGLRETADPVEAIGVDRAIDAAAHANILLYLYDASVGWSPEDENVLERLAPDTQQSVIVLANKSDLAQGDRGLAVSAMSGAGLNDVARVIADRVRDNGAPPVNERQRASLLLAAEALHECAQAAARQDPPDLLSVLLSQALEALHRVTGTRGDASVLDEIFSRFCVGK